MRRILIESARRKRAACHGGGQRPVRLTDLDLSAGHDDDRVLAVDEALGKFAILDPRKAELVKLRYFAGLSMQETIGVLAIPERTAQRWWSYARAWFQEELGQV